MRLDTVFDVASLTMTLAVWFTMGSLAEYDKLDLHAPLSTFWDEAAGHPGPGHGYSGVGLTTVLASAGFHTSWLKMFARSRCCTWWSG